MITTRALLVLAASLIVCLEVQAQTCPINTTVYFGNGVNTSLEDTQRNARIIGRFLMNQVPASDRCRYEFKAAYNPSVNLWVDLVEAARQTLGNEYPTLLLAFILHKIGVPPVFTNLLPPGALESFNARFRNATVQELLSGSASSETVISHVALYQSDLEQKRVILVAHSQGTIYANLAASRLQEIVPPLYSRFAIIPVASPEPDKSPEPEYDCPRCLVGHVRFVDDLVIGGVQIARDIAGLPPPLSANDVDDVGTDWKSHAFLEAYFSDESSRSFILDGILSTSAQLPMPTSPSSSIGAVRYLTFVEGNPGIAGDGQFINTDYLFRLSQPASLQGVPNEITITMFAGPGISVFGITGWFRARAANDCSFNLTSGQGAEHVQVNGTTGLKVHVRRQELEWAISLYPACSGRAVDDLELYHLYIQTGPPDPTATITSLDAASVGAGPNAIPSATTAPP